MLAGEAAEADGPAFHRRNQSLKGDAELIETVEGTALLDRVVHGHSFYTIRITHDTGGNSPCGKCGTFFFLSRYDDRRCTSSAGTGERPTSACGSSTRARSRLKSAPTRGPRSWRRSRETGR